MTEPVAEFVPGRPGGLASQRAECRDGKAQRIFAQNGPSFAQKLDTKPEVEGIGSLTVDTAFGGGRFLMVDAAATGFPWWRIRRMKLPDWVRAPPCGPAHPS